MVAVVTMAATENPAIDDSVNPPKYEDDAQRLVMEDNMRTILRLAGNHYHRRLVLGAIGCGVFKHPTKEVANCWKTVLQEEEFKGWFEMIVFAVLDWSADLKPFRPCRETLHDIQI